MRQYLKTGQFRLLPNPFLIFTIMFPYCSTLHNLSSWNIIIKYL